MGDQRRQTEIGGKIGAGRGMVVEVTIFLNSLNIFRFFKMVVEVKIFF